MTHLHDIENQTLFNKGIYSNIHREMYTIVIEDSFELEFRITAAKVRGRRQKFQWQ